MGKNFKNINEELERIKTLMFETDNLILNRNNRLDEQSTPKTTEEPKTEKFKTARSSFKLAKVSDVNTVLRGGAAKFDTYKLKGTGVMNLFDQSGKMTPEGIALMKKSGLTLPAGQIVMRIGKVDDPNTDKTFFQVVPSKDIDVVTKSGDIKNVNPAELEKLPTVQDIKPTIKPPSGGGQDVPPVGTQTPSKEEKPAVGATPSGESLVGKNISELKNAKIKDITPEFKSVGYGKNMNVYYKLNSDTMDVYRTDMDGKITAVFKRNKIAATNENLSLDLVFVNPLLFESVIIEENSTISEDYYECVGDCKGQKNMSDKFTQVVDGTYKGGQAKKPTGEEGKKPTSGEVKKPTGEEGKKPDTSTAPPKQKYSVVTDADLMGETGLIRNIMKSAPVIAAVTAIVSPIGIPFLLLSAGASAAFNQVSRRSGVKGVVDALDYIVTQDDLAYVLAVVKSLNNKFYNDEEIGGYVPATKRFLELYSEDEGGDDLISDIQSVGTRTLPTGSEKLKSIIIKTINTQVSTPVPAELTPRKEGSM